MITFGLEKTIVKNHLKPLWTQFKRELIRHDFEVYFVDSHLGFFLFDYKFKPEKSTFLCIMEKSVDSKNLYLQFYLFFSSEPFKLRKVIMTLLEDVFVHQLGFKLM